MEGRKDRENLERIRKGLLDFSSYPHEVKDIRLKETHISLLFFTGDFVYKVKKPVNFGFLDFTSKEKRKYYCEREILLNRRLASDIYIGLSKITLDDDRIKIDGEGEVLDYAVKMREFPEEFLLINLLKNNKVTESMIITIAHILTEFYRNAKRDERIESFARPERIKEDTDENFIQTEKYLSVTISEEIFKFIKERTNRFLERKDIFERRIKEGKIRDCHGDLRLEHIFFGDKVFIFDCIEFNERFRFIDVANDIAFLSMDFAFNGREDLEEIFLDNYIRFSGDREIFEVLDFYRCYRAYVRGKVESFRLDETQMDIEEKELAKKRAQRYFLLARNYAERMKI